MASAAQITSVEAIESFRSRLIVYLGQMRPLLEEISHEAVQARLWLEGEQQRFWQDQFRRRYRKLEEARQELFSARLSNFQEASALHHMAVTRAQRAVAEAEDKLAAIKKWTLEIEDRTAPLTRQVDALQSFLTIDMGGAVAYLDQVLSALAAYRDVARPGGGPGNPPPGKTEGQP
jgi:hypothetical protein